MPIGHQHGIKSRRKGTATRCGLRLDIARQSCRNANFGITAPTLRRHRNSDMVRVASKSGSCGLVGSM